MWVMDPICLLHWHKRSLSRYALFNVMPHFRIYNNSFYAPLSRGSRTPLSAADVETETEKQDRINNENIYWTRLEMGCCWVNTDFLIESTVGILLSVQDYICRHDGCWWISQGHLNQTNEETTLIQQCSAGVFFSLQVFIVRLLHLTPAEILITSACSSVFYWKYIFRILQTSPHKKGIKHFYGFCCFWFVLSGVFDIKMSQNAIDYFCYFIWNHILKNIIF